MMQATQDMGASMNDDNTSEHLSEGDAAEALLRQWSKPENEEGEDASKKKPSAKKTDEEDTESTDEAETEDSAEKPETEEDAETEEGSEETEGDDKDEAFVKVKVGDKEHEVPVSKLTRLYGQEAALTQKSMEVAEQRKTFETKLQEQAVTTNALLDRARTRYEPYSKIDFNLLAASVSSGQISTEEYQALRQSAQAAYEDVAFLEHHTADFMQKLSNQRNEVITTQAKEAVKVLSGPVDKGGIEGWNQKLYDDIRAYAVSQGAPKDVVNTTTDPWAIKMMHAAMLFARGQGKAKGDVVITKVNNSPKRIVKTTTSPSSAKSSGKEATASSAFKKFASSGSTDDAAEALLARWKTASDD